MANNDVSGGVARMDSRGTVVRFQKEDYLTLLHTKYKSSLTHGFCEKGFILTIQALGLVVSPIISLW